MYPLIFSGVFAVAAIVAIVYGIFSSSSSTKVAQAKEGAADDKQRLIESLENGLASAKGELEKTKSQHQACLVELQSLQQSEAALKEAGVRLKEQFDKMQIGREQLGKERDFLKEQLANLDRQIQESQERAKKTEQLERQNKDIQEQNAALEARLGASNREVEALTVALAESKKKAEAALASSQEAEGLKKQIDLKEEALQKAFLETEAVRKELEAKEASIKDLGIENETLKKELEDLKRQLQAKDEEAAASGARHEGVSLEEYNKLKERLEAAEKVLRLVHGVDS